MITLPDTDQLLTRLEDADAAYQARTGCKPFRPTSLDLSRPVMPDGDPWCAALYGTSYDDRLAGYGHSPDAAISDLRNRIAAMRNPRDRERADLERRAAALGLTLMQKEAAQ